MGVSFDYYSNYINLNCYYYYKN